MPTQTEVETPTVYIVFGGTEACALTEKGEVVCAGFNGITHGPAPTDLQRPNIPWEDGSLADARGGGGQEGYAQLVKALRAGEENAKLLGMDIVRVKD